MGFPTQSFSGPASGAFGSLSTNGTFNASITGNADGTVTGTWSFSGFYSDTGPYGTSGAEAISGTLTGTGGANGPWTLTLSGAGILSEGSTLSYANGQYSLGVAAGYGVDYFVALGYDGVVMYHDQFDFHAALAVAGTAPGSDPTHITGTEGADQLTGTTASDTIVALGGNDTITGGAGSDTIDGGDGIDTVVFSDVRAAYTITALGNGTYAVAHTGTSDTATLTNVERLVFTDEKVAIDVNGDAGMAYRLYQAAFNRLPDLGGLGYQMNDLDTGHTLSWVAANFIASPEFQATYGNVDNTQFITLLYQNVLHRAPDPGGLQFHLDEFASGQSRADILTHFSESPENQANVIGAIQDGMVYIF